MTDKAQTAPAPESSPPPSARLVISAVAAPLYGKLGDLYGRKLMMQLSVKIFLLGSALAGLSMSMWFLIGARALQGVGGGGLFVLALTVIGDILPPGGAGRLNARALAAMPEAMQAQVLDAFTTAPHPVFLVAAAAAFAAFVISTRLVEIPLRGRGL